MSDPRLFSLHSYPHPLSMRFLRVICFRNSYPSLNGMFDPCNELQGPYLKSRLVLFEVMIISLTLMSVQSPKASGY